jgi:gluconolactonase
MRIRTITLSAASALAILSANMIATAQTSPVAPQGTPLPQEKSDAPGQFALQAESPKFWDLVDKNETLQKVTSGFSFTEGPVWDEKGGFLYVSDEDQNRVARVYQDGRVETVLNIGDPDGATFDQHHRLIETASVLRAMIRVAPDGNYEILADRYDGKKLNSPNDVVLGPDGAVYFTDPTLDLVKGAKQELPYQGIFRMEDTGALKLLATDMAVPNGIAFSPDGKRLYVNDTRAREIRAYDFFHGEIKNGRLFAKEGSGQGGPDGMKVDVKGNVWVTGPGGVWARRAWRSRSPTCLSPISPTTCAGSTWDQWSIPNCCSRRSLRRSACVALTCPWPPCGRATGSAPGPGTGQFRAGAGRRALGSWSCWLPVRACTRW